MIGMLTLRKLIVATPRPVMIRALMQCRVNVTRAVEDVDDFGNTVKECAGLVRATDGDRFAVIMFYEPSKKNLAESKVWAHCSCPYFTFNVEVTNALKKSSDVINSNGELPMVRNPRMIPHFCKHLVALSKLAVSTKYKHVAGKRQKRAPDEKVPPSKALKKPGERVQPQKQAPKPDKKPLAPPRAGPKPPRGPAGPKPIAGPKPVRPVGGPRKRP